MGTPSVSSGLIGHWRLDGDATADVGPDGSEVNGTIYAADVPSAISSEMTESADFDGTNDYISIVDIDEGALPACSYGGWVKLETLSVTTWLWGLRTFATVYDGALQRVSNNRLYWYLNTGASIYCYSDAITDTTNFHHIMCVFDGTKGTNNHRVKIYIDGADATAAFVGTFPATLAVNDILLAFAYNPSYHNGHLSDFRLYNRALSGSEVSDIYDGDYVSGGGDPTPTYKTRLQNRISNRLGSRI